MKKNYSSLYLLFFVWLALPYYICAMDGFQDQLSAEQISDSSIAQENELEQAQFAKQDTLQALAQEIKSKKKPFFSRDKHVSTIDFSYTNEKLVDIINEIAGKMNYNVILPQGATAITQEITFSLPEKVTAPRAWELLYTLLDIAGYSMYPKDNMYEITKNNPNITREPLPLYIGVAPNNLPDTDQRIRYIYYLSNIKVSDAPESETLAILQNLLPPGTSSFKIDAATNAIIISAKANDIKSVMQIIVDLDKIEYQETLAFVKLRYVTAKVVADLFNEKILKAGTDLNRYHLAARQQTEMSFFSKHIRIIPEERTNTLILLGRPQAVERVKDFIQEYIDVELEEGKSILHIYQLQYLDADQIATVLTNIINAAREGGTGQSQLVGGVNPGAIKTFDEVIIKSDKPINAAETKYYGGNKLIVSCRNEDWKIIERLIAELDIPQPQVLLEILVADLTSEDVHSLGTQLRNPAGLPVPGNSSAQSAQLEAPLSNAFPPAVGTSLASDLLQDAYNINSTQDCVIANPGPGTNSIAYCAPQNGAAVVSFNDPNGTTWGIGQVLNAINLTKIISHPHVITISNKEATLNIGQTRLLVDEAVGSGGTTTTIKNKLIDAHLNIKVTPRISAANTILLEINVDIQNFTATASSNDNTRVNRTIITSAIVKDQNVLALGGLIQTTDNDNNTEVPILGKIPILGWLFKNRTKDVVKQNLTIFISPTIIQPRLRSGVSEYTRDYINVAKSYVHDGALFDSLHDPVTRWYFKMGNDANDIVDEFLDKDELKRDLQTTTKPNPRKKPLPKVTEKLTRAMPMERKIAKTNSKQSLEQLIAQDDNNPLFTNKTPAAA
jgi:general secretion pathway protein D